MAERAGAQIIQFIASTVLTRLAAAGGLRHGGAGVYLCAGARRAWSRTVSATPRSKKKKTPTTSTFPRCSISIRRGACSSTRFPFSARCLSRNSITTNCLRRSCVRVVHDDHHFGTEKRPAGVRLALSFWVSRRNSSGHARRHLAVRRCRYRSCHDGYLRRALVVQKLNNPRGGYPCAVVHHRLAPEADVFPFRGSRAGRFSYGWKIMVPSGGGRALQQSQPGADRKILHPFRARLLQPGQAFAGSGSSPTSTRRSTRCFFPPCRVKQDDRSRVKAMTRRAIMVSTYPYGAPDDGGLTL